MEALVLTLGILLIFVGFIIIMLSLILSHMKPGPERREAKVSGGGVVIIGPVPIVFGTDKRMALAAAVVGAVLTIIVLLVFLITNGYIVIPGGVR
ncbi:MAG: DUF131 domain-containing protein [Desulfurococcales archaeon]|nr:DUF131 domain-containing protein [Desulfurococcales archaeon]